MNVIKIEDNKAVFSNVNECILCCRCSNFCPQSVITILNTVKEPLFKGPDKKTYQEIIKNKKA